MNTQLNILSAALALLFLSCCFVRADDKSRLYSVSFPVLVQVTDEAGAPIEGASIQQAGVELAKTIAAYRDHNSPSCEPFKRRTYTSSLGIATLALVCTRQSSDEIRTAKPETCEILVAANGYAQEKLLLSTVRLGHIDPGENSTGVYTLKVMLKKNNDTPEKNNNCKGVQN